MTIQTRVLAACLLLLAAGTPLAAQDAPANNEKEFEQQYQERIKKERLNNVYIPKNLDDALNQLDKLVSDESKAKFKSLPEDSVALVMHHRLGRWMIMNWGFLGGSRLSHYLRSAGITFPEDMADFLIVAYHRRLHGKPVGIKELASTFRQKRKLEWEAEKKQRKVISETERKRTPPPDKAAEKPPAPAPKTTPASAPTTKPNDKTRKNRR